MRRLFGSRGSGSRQDAPLIEEAAESHASDDDLDGLAAYIKKEKQAAWKTKKEGPPKQGARKVTGGGQTLNGFNRKTGLRSKCYRRDSEYHLAPRCPRRDTPRWEGRLFSPERARSQRPSYSSISTETPASPQKAESARGRETGGKCEQSFVTTVGAGDAFVAPQGAAWWRWAPAQRPTLYVSVGWRAVSVAWNDMGFHGLPHSPPKQDSALAIGAVERCAARQIFKWGSLGIRARSLRLRWKGIFQRYCVRAP